ncbi:MAG: hypothetical protein ACM3U2_10860 [Deltaproteobacteria bacterium]
MTAPASVPQTWKCPGCGKLFRVAPGRNAPALCPACRATRATSPAESSAFDQLSAVVQAEEDRTPLAARAAPPVESRRAAQFEPTPFERLFKSVEVGDPAKDAEESRPGGAHPSADVPPENSKAPNLSKPRRRSSGQWRVIAVVGTASVILAGWGLYRILGQLEGSIPGEAEVWWQARAEVADHLRAPKTAEFPKPGEIRPIHGTAKPSWAVKSVVDSKNERGIPLRHPWSLEISYDRRARQWETAWIEIDGERVYASEATIREDREYTERKAAAKKEHERERARQQRKTRATSTVIQRTRASDSEDEGPPDPDREARRERGQWRDVANFEGVGRYETKPFRVPAGGWRYRWVCDGDATIRLYDAAGKLVGEEIEVFSGDRGTQFVRGEPGEFTLKINSEERWMLVVEE